MKIIYRIARNELATLFYSPIAWLILVIFTFQACLNFSDYFISVTKSQSMGYSMYVLTLRLFSDSLFSRVQEYLYLYIPLLTMGLMSRELSSGSIKLLYSSPISSTKIILGKYLSMIIYGLLLIGVLAVLVVFGFFTIENLDVPLVLSGLLGIYLLICAYAAIGLFMSSITSYQVVAAMGTLALLAVLNYIGKMGQTIDIVRDITYWLSISGRADELIGGLICSEDVLYFVIVIVLFVMLSIMRLQFTKQSISFGKQMMAYTGVCCVAMVLGYSSARPRLMFFYDTTATKCRTLTPNSQEIVKQVSGGLTITTYVNLLENNYTYGLPRTRNEDLRRFKQYTRFKPEIDLKYVYYYHDVKDEYNSGAYKDLKGKDRAEKIIKALDLNEKIFLSPEKLDEIIDLSSEEYRFVRVLERANGQKTFLRIYQDLQRFPSEAEISVAFKRLVTKLPKVGFLYEHGERDIKSTGERGYYNFVQNPTFRYALINQGFDVEQVSLSGEIPLDIDILVIAEVREMFSIADLDKIEKYVQRGGNLVILGDVGRQVYMNPLVELLGIQFMQGILVQHNEEQLPNLIVSNPTRVAGEQTYYFQSLVKYENKVSMPGCVGLDCMRDKGFEVIPLLVTDSVGSWNELETINFIDEKVSCNPHIGEEEIAIPTAIALVREVDNKKQKIIIVGDADCISNAELSVTRKGISASNFTFVRGMFHWLSDYQVPIDIRRSAMNDNVITTSVEAAIAMKWIFVLLFPALLIFCGICLWIRRKGR